MLGDTDLTKQQMCKNANEKIISDEKRKPDVICKPKSSIVEDPFLQLFLDSSFDPADYLNNHLPPLSRSKSTQSAKNSIPLCQLSPLAQNLVSQVNANTTRLTAVLTQLTDEILRSGGRLAYEVEILQENTLNLSEALTEGLHDDLTNFVPKSLESTPNKVTEPFERPKIISTTHIKSPINQNPTFIEQLRTLSLIRSRLEQVIKIFGNAMAWTFPPSEVSTASSFLSISGPDLGSEIEGCSIEEKGQQDSKKLRKEISDLLHSDDPISGIEFAINRIEELKELVVVWRGTSEERPRLKFIENLAKMVEERHKELLRDNELNIHLLQVSKIPHDDRNEASESKNLGGYGFISQLQKLRGP